MPLSKPETTIAEAIKNMLDDTALGVVAHKDKDDERAHMFTFLHEEIEQAYKLAVINLGHHNDVCSAFSKIHSHKYLDDPSFALSFKKELSARAVPLEEQVSALKAIDKIAKKMLGETNEKDAGWNPDLDEIIKVSQPKQIEESAGKGPIIDNYSKERQFFSDPKARKWVSSQESFWESIDSRIRPFLEELGSEYNTPKEFWAVYDDDSYEFLIRNRMHELFEELHAKYQTI